MISFNVSTFSELPDTGLIVGQRAYVQDTKKFYIADTTTTWHEITGVEGPPGDPGNNGSNGADGADGVSFAIVSFHADGGANLTLTNQANAEQFLGNSNRNITKIDLTNFSQARLVARVVTGSASANTPRIYLQYHTSFTTTAATYSDIGESAINCSLTNAGLIDSGWINLVAGAQADIFLTVLQNGGDAAADPALGIVEAHFR